MSVESDIAWERFAARLDQWLSSEKFVDFPEELEEPPTGDIPETVVRHLQQLQSRMLVSVASAEVEAAGLAHSLKALRSIGTNKYSISRSAYLDSQA